MRLTDNEEKGKRVVLTEDERNQLLGYYSDDMEKAIALSLMAEAGCRSREALSITPGDVQPMETEDGSEAFKLRIWEGKGEDDGKYRETPIPNQLAYKIQGFAQSNREEDEPLVNASRRTLQRWVQSAAGALEEETGDEGWDCFSSHDCRRTWANLALENDASPTAVMQAGGWENFKVFREHYMEDHGDKFMSRQFAGVTG